MDVPPATVSTDPTPTPPRRGRIRISDLLAASDPSPVTTAPPFLPTTTEITPTSTCLSTTSGVMMNAPSHPHPHATARVRRPPRRIHRPNERNDDDHHHHDDTDSDEPNEEEDSVVQRGKRLRRPRQPPSRRGAFHCDFPGCFKSYSSEGSLRQHKKLKHFNVAQS